MEQLITETLGYARDHFTAFGLETAQVDALLVAGERDLRKELLQLKALAEAVPMDNDKVAQSLHALKGLLMNMGNNSAGQVFAELETAFKATREVAGILALLAAG
ncbi:hypothetical protein ACM66T_08755 [Sulfurimonas sp. ST-25]|uniref:hypothetical protein n=1 Tax=Sulfurimonas sp. ST-25 TaxID=3400151 RepID=UPI003A8B8683